MLGRPTHIQSAQPTTTEHASSVDAGKARIAEPLGANEQRLDRFWLAALFAAAVAVRMFGFHQPFVGNFATKHCVYAMAARNWALDRAPFRYPTLDSLTEGVRAWHLMEWPASAFLAAMGQRAFGGSLDAWGRTVGISCSAIAVVLAFLLARRWFGSLAARATAVVVAFAPAAIIYGRGFMLEPSLTVLTFGAVLAFDVGLRERRFWALGAAALCTSLLIATKVYMLLLFLPLAALWLRRNSAAEPTSPRRAIAADLFTFVAFAVALAPTLWWYAHVAAVPSTSGPAADFHPLSRAGVQAFPNALLFAPGYYFAVARDLATLLLTPPGAILFLVGLLDARSRRLWPWLGSVGLLVVLLPLKFRFANYYQLVLLPPAAMAVGVGWQRLVERYPPNRRATGLTLAVGFLFAARFTVGPAFRIPAEDRGVTAAAEVLRSLAAVDEPVATLHGSTLDLLYYCDRTGWVLDANDPQIVERIDDSAAAGARLFVLVGETTALRNDALTKWRATRGPIRRGDDWAIYRLDPPRSVAEKSPTAATR